MAEQRGKTEDITRANRAEKNRSYEGNCKNSKAKEKKSMASVLKGVSNGKKYNLIDNPIMTKIDKKIILLFAL